MKTRFSDRQMRFLEWQEKIGWGDTKLRFWRGKNKFDKRIIYFWMSKRKWHSLMWIKLPIIRLNKLTQSKGWNLAMNCSNPSIPFDHCPFHLLPLNSPENANKFRQFAFHVRLDPCKIEINLGKFTNQILPPFVPFLLRFPSKIFAVLSMPSINSGFLRSSEIWWEASNKSKQIFAQLIADKWSRWSALNCSTLKLALWKLI